MTADASQIRIRPGTLDDNELGATEASFEVALHNRTAIDHLLGRGYQMDAFMTLICSSEPFGSFDRYLFCAPGLIL